MAANVFVNEVVAADVCVSLESGHGIWQIGGKLTSAVSVWSTPAGEDVIFGVPISKSVESSLSLQFCNFQLQ